MSSIHLDVKSEFNNYYISKTEFVNFRHGSSSLNNQSTNFL